jgi:branched-chain amino acid transport system ATP-binding protein
VSVLEVDAIDVRHGLLRAVRAVSLKVDEGEVVSIVGANGAGKTSLLRGIAGADRIASGRVLFDGEDVTKLPVHRRLRAGIAYVPEGRKLFRELTVEENLLAAQANGRPGPWSVDAVIEAFPMLAKRRHAAAGNLSGGEQQAAAIGRALVTNPRVLLLDEVSLGLAPVAVEDVYRSLRTVLAGGTTILLVEQDIGRALAVAGRVLCMLEGSVALEGATADITREQVTGAYFGLHRGQKGETAWTG